MSTKTKRKSIHKEKAPAIVATPSKRKFDPYLISLAAVLLFIAMVRIRLAAIPLERDEGEYAYIGKLILQGFSPYKAAYNMKLPGTYVFYAVLMSVLGRNLHGVHYGLMLVNCSTVLLLFLGLRKIYNSSVAFFTGAIYGIMSLSPTVLGFAAHATQFVTFFLAAGILFAGRFYEKKKNTDVFFVALMMGLSFLMKQQAVFFILFGAVFIVSVLAFERPFPLKSVSLRIGVYALGAVLPYLVTVAILKANGAFGNFWFWTVEYASKYAASVSLKDGAGLFYDTFKPMWNDFKFVWLLFFGGIVLTAFAKLSLQQKFFAWTLTLLSFLSVCPGFYFRQHYFIPFLPAIGLMGAILLNYLDSFLSKSLKLKTLALPGIIAFIIFIATMADRKEYYFTEDTDEISREVYGTNPFIESIEVSNYLKNNSLPTDKIAIIGSEPQIYFYTDRSSATGYIYTYPLMEKQKYNDRMQKEMISEIESNKPRFLVFCGVGTSWLRRPDSPNTIFDWFNSYSQREYDLTGIADIGAQTFYKWGGEVKNYQMKSNQYLLVYKKKIVRGAP